MLVLHLLSIGLWLGCVLTEALFERALLGRGRAQELLLVDLHKRVDIWVEVPAFMAVVVTGCLLLVQVTPSFLLAIKVGLGLLAIMANGLCVGVVFSRAKAAHEGHWEQFEKHDHLQHKLGAFVLVGMLGALLIGLTLSTAMKAGE